jgi:hypothetical protein
VGSAPSPSTERNHKRVCHGPRRRAKRDEDAQSARNRDREGAGVFDRAVADLEASPSKQKKRSGNGRIIVAIQEVKTEILVKGAYAVRLLERNRQRKTPR